MGLASAPYRPTKCEILPLPLQPSPIRVLSARLDCTRWTVLVRREGTAKDGKGGKWACDPATEDFGKAETETLAGSARDLSLLSPRQAPEADG